MSRIAVLGLGSMGSRMAARLVAAGHDVVVWNRTAAAAEPLLDAGARAAATPRAAAAGRDVVLSMVRDDAGARTVWLDPKIGALAGMSASALAVESSTVTPAWARELARRGRDHGVAVLDAPVVGSRPQAAAGALIFLVGGEVEHLARAEPMFLAMGAAVHHIGPAGAGAQSKLAVNALFAIQVAAVAELFGAAARAGLPAQAIADAVGSTPVASAAVVAAAQAMLAGAHVPSFPVELVVKDLGYVADPATPITTAAFTVFERAVAAGHGAANITAVARLYDV